MTLVLLKIAFMLFLSNLGLYIGYVHLAWRVRKLEGRARQ